MNISASHPILGFCAASSGVGKTTLLCQLIPLLKAHGLRIALIKHAHHSLNLDTPGKDTHQFHHAGAEQVILASPQCSARLYGRPSADGEASLQEALQWVQADYADLILVEGFRHIAYPRIEIHRPSLGKALLYPHDPNIIAIATDTPLPNSTLIPQLDLNAPAGIVAFVLEWLRIEQPSPPAHLPQGEGSRTWFLDSPNCTDPSEPDSLSLVEARSRILASVQPLQNQLKVALRSALGQVLAQTLISPVNIPAHDNSAMDGYALAGRDLPTGHIKSYQVIGSVFAGASFATPSEAGQCVRIMTGAPMPNGTDTVIIQEHVKVDGSSVRIGTGHRTGQNVRYAGEDIATGETVLQAGHRIKAADLGLLASLGIAEVLVYRRPRVAFFSTGDELRSLGEPLGVGCVYDSNRYTLYGMLSAMGMDVLDMGVVRDDPAALEHAFLSAAANADVVITSGGVSVGEADFTKQILSKLGTINFWKIAIKPGRPLAFGMLGNTLFFGLPGNPVAVMVAFEQLVRNALLKLSGEHASPPLLLRATLQQPIRKRAGRTEFLRGILIADSNGELQVHKTGAQGSGILSSMSQANCYIVLSEQCGDLTSGDSVLVQPF